MIYVIKIGVVIGQQFEIYHLLQKSWLFGGFGANINNITSSIFTKSNVTVKEMVPKTFYCILLSIFKLGRCWNESLHHKILGWKICVAPPFSCHNGRF